MSNSFANEELTLALSYIYESWFRAPVMPTIYDIIVVNKILYYFDNDISCGIKELNAELFISKGTTSKVLKKLLVNKLLIRHKSEADKRRYFYKPTEFLLNHRQIALDNFRQSLGI